MTFRDSMNTKKRLMNTKEGAAMHFVAHFQADRWCPPGCCLPASRRGLEKGEQS